MTFRTRSFSVAIGAEDQGRPGKLGTAIQKLAEEDPTFQVKQDEETVRRSSPAWASLHLEVLVNRC